MELGHLVNVLPWEGMWVNLIRWLKYLTGSRKSVRFLIMFWVYCPFSHFDEWLAQKPFEMNAIKLAHPFWCWLFYDLEVTAEFQKKLLRFFHWLRLLSGRTYIFRSFFEMPFSTFLFYMHLFNPLAMGHVWLPLHSSSPLKGKSIFL